MCVCYFLSQTGHTSISQPNAFGSSWNFQRFKDWSPELINNVRARACAPCACTARENLYETLAILLCLFYSFVFPWSFSWLKMKTLRPRSRVGIEVNQVLGFMYFFFSSQKVLQNGQKWSKYHFLLLAAKICNLKIVVKLKSFSTSSKVISTKKGIYGWAWGPQWWVESPLATTDHFRSAEFGFNE